MTVNAKVEVITPAKASKWLESMVTNRPLREHLVLRHAESMERGEWHLTGETVKFDEHGRLLDGQHRLKAVELAGIDVPMLVARGVPSDAMIVMDTGLKRTLGDVLKLRGEQSAILLAATLTCTLQTRSAIRIGKWPGKGGSTGGSQYFPTNDWCLQLLEEEPGIRESVRASSTYMKKTGVSVFPKVVASALHILRDVDENDAEEFFKILHKGTNLDEYDAIHKFRVRFAVNNPDRPNTTRDQMAYLLKTWNYWRSGTSVSQLRIRFGGKNPEDFPVPK